MFVQMCNVWAQKTDRGTQCVHRHVCKCDCCMYVQVPAAVCVKVCGLVCVVMTV